MKSCYPYCAFPLSYHWHPQYHLFIEQHFKITDIPRNFENIVFNFVVSTVPADGHAPTGARTNSKHNDNQVLFLYMEVREWGLNPGSILCHVGYNRLISQMRATLAACREPVGKLWQLWKVLYVFEHKTQYLLIHAPWQWFRRVKFVVILPRFV